MKYGAMNFPVRPLLREIQEIAEMGFDYVEITLDPPEATPQKVLAQKKPILDLLAESRLGMMGHLPTFVLPADLYERFRKVSLQENFEALEAGAELGMRKMVLHPGVLTGLGKLVADRAKGYAMESMESILKRANQLGITLCLENMFPQAHFLSQPYEFQEVFEAFPETRLTLDIGHANLGGGRNRSYEFIQRFGYRLGHIHVGDNFGREDSHLPVGAGIIDFDKILKEVKGAHYDDTMTIEVFSRDRDYLRISMEKMKRMWENL
jgi:sugar phosphate isomerase/epimerase